MAGGERDRLVVGVGEGELGLSIWFRPGGFDGLAVLENNGFTGAGRSDVLVIAVGGGGLLDIENNDDARRNLLGLTTLLLGFWFT